MTTLSKDEIITMVDECHLVPRGKTYTIEPYERFATLCRADLVEEIRTLKADAENFSPTIGLVDKLQLERDAYSKAADDMAAAHKVERDLHQAEVERLTGMCEKYNDVILQSTIDASNEIIKLRADNERLTSLAKEYRDNGDRLLDVTDSLKAELSALRAGSGEAVREMTWNLEYADSTPKLNVMHSAFEDWFQQQPFATQSGIKQLCRDSYAAGMGDPLVTYATPQPSAVPVVRELVEALEHIQRCIGFGTATIHQGSATWCQSDDAITTGQAWLKECGE